MIMYMKKLIILVGVFIIYAMVGIYSGKAQVGSPEKFDLVFYGKGLENESVIVELRKNPGLDDQWTKINRREQFEISQYSVDDVSLLVIRGLPWKRFVGQDIRENYIGMRLSIHEELQSRVYYRGAWALHHRDSLTPDTLETWIKYIHRRPLLMKQNAFATLVYPRYKQILPNKPILDHIELPVRPLKAGIQEVKWLEIIFSD